MLCGAGILGYFGGHVMTINDIMTLGEIGVMGYYVGLSMSPTFPLAFQ